MRLEEFLRAYLPRADRRCRIAPARGITLLLKNVLLSREPLYGVGEWAARYAPEALGFADTQLPALNDDRVGRCLDRLFRSDVSSMVLALAAHVVQEFQVDLDELHNDSTTITFHGAYGDAAQEEKRGQQTRMAITWGYNKDHRPDLKQLLYILTVAGDGAVPLYFQVASGNVVDDKTHIASWDFLCRLVGRPNFLSVADCKLASTENMAISINTKAGSSPCSPGLDPRTAPSGTCCKAARFNGAPSTTSGMTMARSWTSTAPTCLPRSAPKGIAWSGITARARRNRMPARGISKSSGR